MADDLKFVISVDDRDLIRAQKEQRKFQANVITIEQAYRSGAITASRYNGELAKQASQLSKLGGNYNKANSEVRKYAYSIRNATNEQLALSAASVSGGKSVNRFGMYAQQVGYQVGDFFVQVQSGTSALVAFGQQGTQLAGLLPGLTGAVVGIGLAVGTMLARSFLQAQEASEAAGGSFSNLKDVIKEVAEELKVLNEELEFILSGAESKGIAAVNKKIAESFVEIYAAANLLKDFKLDITPSMSATEVEEITQLFQDELRLTQQLQEKKLTLLLAQKDALVQQREQLEIIKGLQNSEVQEAENLRQNTERANRKDIEDAKIKKALQDQRIASFYKFYTQSRMEGQNLLVEQEAMTKAAQDAMNKYGKMRTVAVEAAKALKEAADQTFRIAQAALALNKPMGVSYQGRATGVDKSGFDYTGPKLDENNNVIADKASKLSGTTLDVLEAEAKARMAALLLGDEELALYERQLDIRQALGDYNDNYSDAAVRAAAERIELLQKEEDAINRIRQRNEDLAQTIAQTMGDGLMSIVDGTKSVEQAFKDMARLIIVELYKVLVVEQMVLAIKNAIRASGYLPFENGSAFSGGNVVPFASGGVVGSPTTFPMSGGRTGLMGEAGPEAIMPLQRGANGKLGVAVNGGESGTTVNQVINISTGVQQTVRNEIRSMMPQIAEASKAAVVDSKRRGGSYGGSFR